MPTWQALTRFNIYLIRIVWAYAWMGSLNPFDEVGTITSHVLKVEETGLEKSCESPGGPEGAGIWGQTCQSLKLCY